MLHSIYETMIQQSMSLFSDSNTIFLRFNRIQSKSSKNSQFIYRLSDEIDEASFRYFSSEVCEKRAEFLGYILMTRFDAVL